MAAYTEEGDEGVRDLLRGLGTKLAESKILMVEQALALLSMDSADVIASEDAHEVVNKTNLSAALVEVNMGKLEAEGVAMKIVSALKKTVWTKDSSKVSAGGDAAGGGSSAGDEPPIVVGRSKTYLRLCLFI